MNYMTTLQPFFESEIPHDQFCPTQFDREECWCPTLRERKPTLEKAHLEEQFPRVPQSGRVRR